MSSRELNINFGANLRKDSNGFPWFVKRKGEIAGDFTTGMRVQIHTYMFSLFIPGTWGRETRGLLLGSTSL
jgi:hypothetical protein